ncbi:S-layer protein [Lysinibacillus contaminans]|uniref:S-layer protein n=1 Tax=Lysinibacillus contaminans TaxID=1293441 RepID=A0ABR5JW94_9BACI|nr:S-layer homology domain-containing protein [Lysinibacillus contaminans]KOS66222.1 S-layer protein [Lysinibacillus contaminans]
MDKTKIQKVNKALIATVFATSGIAVVVPPPQKALAATSPFLDITPYSSHYDNILNLYKQGAIGGYPDKTFRPNQNVTRGQAAKMLATVLNLSLKNLDNPYFTDVPASNEYYKYIAALENAGIMSGYSNGTFMPNEIITRGQLSKMLVLGFKFEVSSSYNHNFKDVNSQTSNAAFIQTLVDLKITEGTTPVTFSPYNAVTRGQIASFIVRAQDKKENVTSYKITSIEDDVVYINAVPYTVPSSLANIFNEDNEEVLKGAVIEGTFTGGNLSYVSKLTLNASGTYTNYLELNGSNSSFGASIVVNGNYIRFADVNLTGTVFINETVRPPLNLNQNVSAGNSLRSIGRIASINSAFINWSNPDQPADKPSKEDSSNGLQNWTNENKNPGSTDVPKKDDPFVNWSKDRLVMKNVEKYVEFYNSSTPHLIVSQNATRIETNRTLPRVDIRGDVREFEIIGNITILNLNTETKLTIYGESNIYRINKYSYTDLELYFDGRVGILYIDNSYGWVDIGDYTYIDRVILPKDEGPNNIFDDFLEDKDNIGGITDPDGKPIDPDDLENQKPADKTKPLVSITNLELLSGSDISFDFTSTEVGTYYYIIREKDADPPTKSEMVNRVSSDNVASGTGSAVVGKNTVKVSNLGEKKEYVLYVMVVDGAKNVSDLANKSFQMKDGSPPAVKSLTVLPLHGGKRAEMKFVASEPGEYYYVVRPKTSAPDPTTKDIIANPTDKGEAKSGELAITEMLKDLTADTTYQVYVVMKDKSGNLSIDPPISKEFTTTAPDNEHPYVADVKLSPAGKENQFYLNVSEALDPETARNVQNYDLSGTVIVNTSGQQRIKPSAVEYKEGDKKVLLTIPSETGFVLGDTLRATVLPGVKDLADNEFVSTATVTGGSPVQNYAEYTHTKHDMPVITIENVIGKPDASDGFNSVEVEFKPNKAGTYYYMVLPDTVVDDGVTKTFQEYIKDKGITERDFVNEFATDSSLHSGYFKIGGKEIYIESGFGPADLEDKTKKFPIKIPKDKLNPFLSYSVYMVLKDRGGEISKIVSKEIVGDMKAPLIRDLVLKPMKNDDTKAEISFHTDETTKLHYWFVPKTIKDASGKDIPNPDANRLIDTPAQRKELEAKLKTSPSVTKSGKGEFALAEAKGATLTPHTDYVVYLGAEDTYGNISVYKANTAGDNHDETPAGWMKQDFYSDGTAPRVEDPIFKRIDGKTFEVTFSEAVGDPSSPGSIITNGKFFDLTNLDGTTATLPSYTWAWDSAAATTDTWKPRKMIITFATEVNKNFALTVNAKVTDKGSATIAGTGISFADGKPTATYIYRPLTTAIESAQLKDPIEINSMGNRSKNIRVTFDFVFSDPSIVSGEMVDYYYKTYTKSYDLQTPNPVDNVTIEEIVVPDVGYALTSLNHGNGKAKFSDGRIVADITHNTAPFIVGDHIIIVIVDKYGNKYKVRGKVSQ